MKNNVSKLDSHCLTRKTFAHQHVVSNKTRMLHNRIISISFLNKEEEESLETFTMQTNPVDRIFFYKTETQRRVKDERDRINASNANLVLSDSNH